MKSVLLKTLPLVFALGMTANANAGDDKMCSIQSSQVAVYGGWASCLTSGYFVDQYVHSSYAPTAYITEFTGGQWRSCWANVPFSHYETLNTEVCEYTPAANFYVSQSPQNPIGTNMVTFSSTSTDRDGSIAKYEWFVDGSATSTSRTLRLSTIMGRTVNVKLKVTDNDGYTDTKERSVYLQPWSCDNSCVLY